MATSKEQARRQRHRRVRKKVRGTPVRPRLNVYRSVKHIYAQLIDDIAGETLAAASSLDAEVADEVDHGGNVEAARIVGRIVAERALDAGIERAVFDRGGYKYHGRIAAVAEGAREAGLDL